MLMADFHVKSNPNHLEVDDVVHEIMKLIAPRNACVYGELVDLCPGTKQHQEGCRAKESDLGSVHFDHSWSRWYFSMISVWRSRIC
jgi:type IV secretory pathway VirJ component